MRLSSNSTDSRDPDGIRSARAFSFRRLRQPDRASVGSLFKWTSMPYLRAVTIVRERANDDTHGTCRLAFSRSNRIADLRYADRHRPTGPGSGRNEPSHRRYRRCGQTHRDENRLLPPSFSAEAVDGAVCDAHGNGMATHR